MPPFLVQCADNDLPFCDRPGAEAFCNALRACGVPAEFRELIKNDAARWKAVAEKANIKLD